MNLAILRCRAQYGTEAPPVTIEVFLSGGLPAFTIVGMPETAVRESKDRVRGALLSSGFEFPQQRITVSLGPAEMRKTGGRYDLAIALGILAARKQFPVTALRGVECYGELALSGELRSVAGLLPSVIKAHEAGHQVIVPRENAPEAALAGATVIGAATLVEVTAHLAGRDPLPLQQAVHLPESTGGASTSPTSRVSSLPSARWRLPRPATTTCSSSAHRGLARACLHDACPGCCQSCRGPRHSKLPQCDQLLAAASLREIGILARFGRPTIRLRRPHWLVGVRV